MEDYAVVRSIGKGSYGKVYLCKHLREAGKQYVLKVIKLKGIPAKEREACRNEVQLMQRLSHPNIVAFKDSFFANNRENLCIVMTYCDGGDLSQRISAQQGAPIKEDQIMHWFVQMCFAVGYMHDKKVLHRDIKAQNVFLLGNGRLVLGDLGISKVLDDSTKSFARTQIGTPYYMSPEIWQNKPYDSKSDVWALGCILYEMTTGKHPFDAQSLPALAQKVNKGAYAPMNAKYSTSLRQLVASMLSANPVARPSVAAILQQPYLKKHVYNFIKDIAERGALAPDAGGGAAPLLRGPSSAGALGAYHAPVPAGAVSDGTMAFRAAFSKAAAGGGRGSDSTEALLSRVAAGGLGPHAEALYLQLVALGLQATVVKALQDAEGGSGTSAVPAAGAAAVAAMGRVPQAAPLAAQRTPAAPPQVGAPAIVLAPFPAVAELLHGASPAVPAVAPLSPRSAKKLLKDRQAALEREEERRRAVEAALAKLRSEKELRAKQREEFVKLQERRQQPQQLQQQQQPNPRAPQSGIAASAGEARGAAVALRGVGGIPPRKVPTGSAAAARPVLPNSAAVYEAAAAIRAAPHQMAAVAGGAAPLHRRPASAQAQLSQPHSAASPQPPPPAAPAAPAAAPPAYRGERSQADGGGAKAASPLAAASPLVSTPTPGGRKPPLPFAAVGSPAPGIIAVAGSDSAAAAALRERAAGIRRDAIAAEAERKRKMMFGAPPLGAVAPALLPSGLAPPLPSAGGPIRVRAQPSAAAAEATASAAAARRSDVDKLHVAALERWESERQLPNSRAGGVAAAAPASCAPTADSAAPIGATKGRSNSAFERVSIPAAGAGRDGSVPASAGGSAAAGLGGAGGSGGAPSPAPAARATREGRMIPVGVAVDTRPRLVVGGPQPLNKPPSYPPVEAAGADAALAPSASRGLVKHMSAAAIISSSPASSSPSMFRAPGSRVSREGSAGGGSPSFATRAPRPPQPQLPLSPALASPPLPGSRSPVLQGAGSSPGKCVPRFGGSPQRGMPELSLSRPAKAPTPPLAAALGGGKLLTPPEQPSLPPASGTVAPPAVAAAAVAPALAPDSAPAAEVVDEEVPLPPSAPLPVSARAESVTSESDAEAEDDVAAVSESAADDDLTDATTILPAAAQPQTPAAEDAEGSERGMCSPSIAAGATDEEALSSYYGYVDGQLPEGDSDSEDSIDLTLVDGSGDVTDSASGDLLQDPLSPFAGLATSNPGTTMEAAAAGFASVVAAGAGSETSSRELLGVAPLNPALLAAASQQHTTTQRSNNSATTTRTKNSTSGSSKAVKKGGGMTLRLDNGTEDDADISSQEAALRLELQRSSLHLHGLRSTLEAARSIAARVGVVQNRKGTVRMSAKAAAQYQASSALAAGASAVAMAARRDPQRILQAFQQQFEATNWPEEGSATCGGNNGEERPIRPSESPGVFGVVVSPAGTSAVERQGAELQHGDGATSIPTATTTRSRMSGPGEAALLPSPLGQPPQSSPLLQSQPSQQALGRSGSLRRAILAPSTAARAAAGGYLRASSSLNGSRQMPSAGTSSTAGAAVSETATAAATSEGALLATAAQPSSTEQSFGDEERTAPVSRASTFQSAASATSSSNTGTLAGDTAAAALDACATTPSPDRPGLGATSSRSEYADDADFIAESSEDEEEGGDDDDDEEDDICDDDGNAEDAVSFALKPGTTSDARSGLDASATAPALPIVPGAIPEVEEDDEAEEDGDEEVNFVDDELEDDTFSDDDEERREAASHAAASAPSGQPRPQLELPILPLSKKMTEPTGARDSARSGGAQAIPANGSSGSGNLSSRSSSAGPGPRGYHLGSMSSRVEAMRARCIAELGEPMFRTVHAAVKRVVQEEAKEAAAVDALRPLRGPHGSPTAAPTTDGATSLDLEDLRARVGLRLVDAMVALVDMEQALL